MRESCTSGSMRGARGNSRPYRNEFAAVHLSTYGVRRDKAALSSGCNPTRQTLQPEATGAVTEVTKWLKPSDSVSRYTVTARVCRP